MPTLTSKMGAFPLLRETRLLKASTKEEGLEHDLKLEVITPGVENRLSHVAQKRQTATYMHIP